MLPGAGHDDALALDVLGAAIARVDPARLIAAHEQAHAKKKTGGKKTKPTR